MVQAPEVARSIEEQGGFVIAGGRDEVNRRVRSDFTSLSRLVKAAGLKVDK